MKNQMIKYHPTSFGQTDQSLFEKYRPFLFLAGFYFLGYIVGSRKRRR